MWSRKRIEIGWPTLFYALFLGVTYFRRPRTTCSILAEPDTSNRLHNGNLIGLSARSLFDLYLQSKNLPRGSEILVSAITIDGMLAILKEHGLVPVPVDLHLDSLGPDMAEIRRKRTRKTRAVLVAHLMGTRLDMAPLQALALELGIEVWEDRAQAFDGERDLAEAATSPSQLVLFSTGPIKSFTALGGGLAVVKDARVLEHMNQLQRDYPVQSRFAYLLRVIRYGFLKCISNFYFYRMALRWLGPDRSSQDLRLSEAFRNFGGDQFFRKIRRRPCSALVRLIRSRLTSANRSLHDRRSKLGHLLSQRLAANFILPGFNNRQHSYWVFPVLVSDEKRDEFLDRLYQAGFDATRRSQLCLVSSSQDVDARRQIVPRATNFMNCVIFLPCYGEMPDEEVERLALCLRDARTMESDDQLLRMGDSRPVTPQSCIKECRPLPRQKAMS